MHIAPIRVPPVPVHARTPLPTELSTHPRPRPLANAPHPAAHLSPSMTTSSRERSVPRDPVHSHVLPRTLDTQSSPPVPVHGPSTRCGGRVLFAKRLFRSTVTFFGERFPAGKKKLNKNPTPQGFWGKDRHMRDERGVQALESLPIVVSLANASRCSCGCNTFLIPEADCPSTLRQQARAALKLTTFAAMRLPGRCTKSSYRSTRAVWSITGFLICTVNCDYCRPAKTRALSANAGDTCVSHIAPMLPQREHWQLGDSKALMAEL